MKIAGIDYLLDWDKFRVGQSFFVPCLDTAQAEAEVRAVVKRLNITIFLQETTEEGVRGIRVWRT
jgi:hypothetical protein